MYRTTYLSDEQRVAEDEMLLRSSIIFHLFGVRLNQNDVSAIALSNDSVQAEKIFKHTAKVHQDIIVDDEDVVDCVKICVEAYNSYCTLMGFADSVGNAMAQWDFDRGRTPMSSWPKDENGRPLGSMDVYSKSQAKFKAEVRLSANTFLNASSRIGTLHTLSSHDRSLGKATFHNTAVERLCRWIDMIMWSYEGDQPVPD